MPLRSLKSWLRPREAPAADAPETRRIALAFREQVARLYIPALEVARRRVASADAEDVVQEAFVGLWQVCYKDGDLPDAPVDPLFWRILRRRIDDHRRRQARQRLWMDDEGQSPDVDHLIDARADTAGVAEGALLAEKVAAALESFPPRMRLVLERAIALEGDLTAVAESTGMSRHLVKWHIREGRSRLRERLAQDGYDVGEALDKQKPAATGLRRLK